MAKDDPIEDSATANGEESTKDVAQDIPAEVEVIAETLAVEEPELSLDSADEDVDDDTVVAVNEDAVPEDLGTAYDLDDGELIKAEAGQSGDNLPWQTKIKTAKEFFGTEILYRYDILEIGDRDKLKGNYRIELGGDPGGVWTISLGDDIDIVNEKGEAEVVLSMDQRDFLLLVNGELNPQLGFLSEKITASGDFKRALTFQNILAPAEE